jgi:uroporphyrinogen decarboxylase
MQTFDDGSYIDFLGCRRFKVANPAGVYDEVLDPPLAHAKTLEEVDDHPWPDPGMYDFSVIKEQCEQFEDKAIVIGSWGMADFINISSRLRGMEQVLMDVGMKNPVIFRIFERLSDFFYEYMKRFYEYYPEKYVIAFFGDDYGTQRGPIISPQTFREVFMPLWKRHFELAHKHGLKVMLHSCGSTRMLMPLFIETGIDILETVQPETAGMTPEELKKEFSNKLCFHGMISVQRVLPHGTPEDVKNVVKERLDVMKNGGGYILAPTHNIQPDTPVENIIAMYEAGHEYGQYN